MNGAPSSMVSPGLWGFLAFFLLAHATQVDPDGSWFHVPRELQQRIWPTEDFEAAVSYVPVVPVETDLFAGIDDAAAGDALATSADLVIRYDGRKEARS